MGLTAALPVFFITLREGVEASLVVGIVLACLTKANATHLHRAVYFGIAAGLLGSLLLGGLLGLGFNPLVYPPGAGLGTGRQRHCCSGRDLCE